MATVEEHIVKIVQQVTGASNANRAMQGIESRIKAEERALAGLDVKLAAANTKLAEMMEGAGKGSVSLAAIDKQRAAVAALQAQIAGKKGDLETLGMAKGVAKMADDAKAKAKADADAKKQEAQAQRNATAEKKKAESDAKKIASDQAKRVAEAKRASQEQVRAQAAESAAAKEALGPLGSLVTMFGSTAAASGGAVGAALALVAALVAIAAGAVAATIALTHFAIVSADAARAQRLLDNAAAGSVARGGELNKIVSEIAANVPIAREQVAEFGRQLQLAGINGSRLQTALTTIAMIESVVPGAGAKIEGLVERFQRLRRAVLTKADLEGTGLALVDVAAQLAKAMGITQAAALQMLQNGTASTDKVLEAMRKAVEQKFGKTIAAQMMSLSVQFQKLKENIAALFSGLDLEPFLAGLKSITDLFSQNTATGRVLKELMTMIFQPIIDGIAKVLPLGRAFFLGLAIGALQVYIALKPLGKAIAEALGGADKAKALENAMWAGRVAAHALGFGIKLIMYGILGAIDIVQGFAAAWDWIQGVIGKIQMIPAALMALIAMGPAAASGLVDGFVNGITSAIGAAVAAVTSLGASVETALRNALGWHSPATLGVDAAGAIGQGFEVGAEKAESGATSAAAGMIDAKSVKAGAKGAKASGKVIYIETLNIGSREDFTTFRGMLIGDFEFQGKT